MDIEASEIREAIDTLRTRIMAAEQQRLNRARTKTIEEVRMYLEASINREKE